MLGLRLRNHTLIPHADSVSLVSQARGDRVARLEPVRGFGSRRKDSVMRPASEGSVPGFSATAMTRSPGLSRVWAASARSSGAVAVKHLPAPPAGEPHEIALATHAREPAVCENVWRSWCGWSPSPNPAGRLPSRMTSLCHSRSAGLPDQPTAIAHWRGSSAAASGQTDRGRAPPWRLPRHLTHRENDEVAGLRQVQSQFQLRTARRPLTNH
jgi:hypothetical protein